MTKFIEMKKLKIVTTEQFYQFDKNFMMSLNRGPKDQEPGTGDPLYHYSAFQDGCNSAL